MNKTLASLNPYLGFISEPALTDRRAAILSKAVLENPCWLAYDDAGFSL